MTDPDHVIPRLRAALGLLAERIEQAGFAMPGPDRAGRRELRRSVTWAIEEYVLPRLDDLDAPVVAVVLGSTGSGKSTIVNSLAGKLVSRPGAIRPTTRAPVVWAHPDNAARYRTGFLNSNETGGRDVRVVEDSAPLLDSLTVIDAPDFDSVEEEHRAIADDLLAVADLCVFVTSAQRYADAVPWEFLGRAGRRGIPIFFIVNRVPAADVATVVDDYRRRLAGRSLLEGAVEFLTITEQQVDQTTGALAAATVAPLRRRLAELGEPDRRRQLIDTALRGAVADVVQRSELLAGGVASEIEESERLARAARGAYDIQRAELHRQVADGSLIRGEVVARWQDVLGTGQLLEVIDQGMSRLRRWFRRVWTGGPEPDRVEREARSELAAGVIRRADAAAAAAASAWELDPAGKAILDSDSSLWRHGAPTPALAERVVEDWLADVTRLVAEEGGSRKRVATAASYGVNVVAVSVMLGVFLHTGGLTGAEVGVAAGAAAAQQKLLEYMFGSAAARGLIARAQEGLRTALDRVLDEDLGRFEAAVAAHRPPEGLAGEIESAAADVGRLLGGAFDG